MGLLMNGVVNELTSRKQNNSHVKEIKLNGSSVSDPPGLSETFNTLPPPQAPLYRSNLNISNI